MYRLLDYLDGTDLEWLIQWIGWTDQNLDWTPCETWIVVDWMMKMEKAKLT
jgi:hypothetical protein